MTATTAGFDPSETLPANTLLRITLSDTSGVLDMSGAFSSGGVFGGSGARALYDSLYQATALALIPTTQLVLPVGVRSAVFDANLKQSMLGADLLNRLERTNKRFAAVTRVERLTGQARSASSSDAGRVARVQVTRDAGALVDQGSIGGQITKGFNRLLNTVKWGGVGILVIAVVYFGAPYLTKRTRG